MKTYIFGACRLRRSRIFQPIATLLVFLLTPLFSWMQSGGSATPTRSMFQASAQVTPTSPGGVLNNGCPSPQPNAIIQILCPQPAVVTPGQISIPNTSYASDLVQLESDAVKAYLQFHGLPATDASLIYTYGRSDLRSAVRASMIAILVGIINKAASARTAHEQSLYSWLQYVVQQNEILEYQNAIAAYNSWKDDPCDFQLDAAIASSSGISYDGAPFCGASLSSIFGGPQVPAESYFTAYGVEQSYGKPGLTYPNFGSLVAQTSKYYGEAAGIGAAAGAILAGLAGGGIALSTAYALTAFLITGGGVYNAAFVVTGATVSLVGGAAVAAGPVAVVFTTVLIGAIAVMELYSDDQTIKDLNNLTSTLQEVTNMAPDLAAFANDRSGLGLYKLQNSLGAQCLPDVPSTAPLPQHQPSDLNFSVAPSGGTALSSQSVTYQDWSGNAWTAQTYGGWFVENCNNVAVCAKSDEPADSLIASLEYVDWSGTHWIGSRLGNVFVSTKQAPAPTDESCPADTLSGVTPLPASGNFNACSSYTSTSISLMDGTGKPVTISLALPPPPPVFSGPTTLPFTASHASTQTIVATGTPTPILSLAGGQLPHDFNLHCGPAGQCQLAYNGDPNAPATTYSITINATDPAPGGATVRQAFTVVLNIDLAFTSPSSFTGTGGKPANFLITTTGYPTPHLSISGTPPGLTFKDLGNGTATITGVPGAPGGYYFSPGITATNAKGTITQAFGIQINSAPEAYLAGPDSATFIAGVSNSVTLQSYGATTPVSWIVTGSRPAWLQFHDNGNGTAVLSGTPTGNTTETYSLGLGPIALGSIGLLKIYTLTVVAPPVFVSPNAAQFRVGRDGAFDIKTSDGSSVTTNFVLPQGLTFTPGSRATISGIPAAGTGGLYTIPLTANGGAAGIATQQLQLSVYESPQITSPNTATFFSGVPGSFQVTTSGFPSLENLNANPPFRGMRFTVDGLPGLALSNLNPQGLATGTLTLQGTPAAAFAGVHNVNIRVDNGEGSSVQTLKLTILNITGPAPASGTTCNGNYNGAFTGNIVVSAGQNCSFVGSGGVVGNITVKGGSFAIAGGTITGDVRISGASAFSFAPGTQINGDLSIHSDSSASTGNQVCGTVVTGNAKAISSSTNIVFGSAAPESCPGNTIGGNLTIDSDSQNVAVYNNTVEQTLSCAHNASIVGAGNTAETKKQQCAEF